MAEKPTQPTPAPAKASPRPSTAKAASGANADAKPGRAAAGANPAVDNRPTHLQVAREAQANLDKAAEQKQRDRRVAQITDELADESDIMFAPGQTDLLCGVVREEGWRYLIVTETTSVHGKSRPNFAKFLGHGYEVAPLPEHLTTKENKGKADWPEISKAILRVRADKYEKFKKWKERELLTLQGAGVDTVKTEGKITGQGPEADSYYVEDSAIRGTSASDLGITPQGVAES